MPDTIHKVLEFIPFMMVATKGGNRRYHLNFADLTKTIIIGIITGLLSAYVTVQRLDVRMNEVEKKIDMIQKDFYKPRVAEGK